MWQIAEHNELGTTLDDRIVLMDLGLDRRVSAGEFFKSLFLRSEAFADVEGLFHGFDRVGAEGRHDQGRSLLVLSWRRR